ncbi:MAG TPA: immunoglobulin domain-containing protein, partial [Verrucomicrobiae bacterium]
MAQPCCASVMAYEGFDYPAAPANLSGQSGGTGWNGSWITVNGPAANVVSGNLLTHTNGITGLDGCSVGNSVQQLNASRSGRMLDVSANSNFALSGYVNAQGRIGADDTTLYLSFLQQPDGATKFYEFEFHRGNLGDPGRIAGIGNDLDFTNVNFRAPNGTQTPIAPGSTNASFYVVRIDFKSGSDDVYIYRNPTHRLETENEPTLMLVNAGDLSFDGISLAAYVNSRTVRHDEIRFGTSWSDVIGGLPAFVSEPADTNAVIGRPLTLTSQAEGKAPISYQWFHHDTAIAEAANSSWTGSALQFSDGGNYYVVASNAVGVVTSRMAQVTLSPLQIYSAGSNQTLRLNEALTLSHEVGGAQPMTLQWFKDGTILNDATNANLLIAGAQVSDAGQYVLVASNVFGVVTSAVNQVFAVSNALLAYDGFDYAEGSANLPGQNGGTGWSDAW